MSKKSASVYIPFVNIYKLYKVYSNPNPDALMRLLQLSKRTIKSYLKFIDFLFNGEARAVMSFEEFKLLLRNKIMEKLDLVKILDIMSQRGLPLNSHTLFTLLRAHGYNVSKTSCKALLSLLRKLEIVSSYPKTVLIKDKKSLVYYYIYTKGEVKFADIKKKFPLRDIQDIIIELYAEDKINIEGFDIPRNLVERYGRYLPVEVLKDSPRSRYINRYIDRRTGKEFYEIVIAPDDKVSANVRKLL